MVFLPVTLNKNMIVEVKIVVGKMDKNSFKSL